MEINLLNNVDVSFYVCRLISNYNLSDPGKIVFYLVSVSTIL